jgi:tRNA threonylcarbamoyladenosine biosynthesis protein TsaB
VKVLGFDTATPATTVAVHDSTTGEMLERRDDPHPGERPRHTARLMSLISELLGETGWGWTQLDRVAVGVGPGTFTGIRIGVATARALVQARELELVGVSTLESLALNAGADAVCAAIDARRGEVFAGVWDGRRRLVMEPAALDPELLAQRIAPRTLVIGDGAIAFRDALERSGAVIPDDDSDLHRVTAVNHCRLGLHMRASDPETVRPQYLRLPDAELSRRAAAKP